MLLMLSVLSQHKGASLCIVIIASRTHNNPRASSQQTAHVATQQDRRLAFASFFEVALFCLALFSQGHSASRTAYSGLVKTMEISDWNCLVFCISRELPCDFKSIVQSRGLSGTAGRQANMQHSSTTTYYSNSTFFKPSRHSCGQQ